MTNTERTARRDAEEYMKAKIYYGKGAGNRRKAIKNKVMAKKTDPEYAKAFDIAYSKLDPGLRPVAVLYMEYLRNYLRTK